MKKEDLDDAELLEKKSKELLSFLSSGDDEDDDDIVFSSDDDEDEEDILVESSSTKFKTSFREKLRRQRDALRKRVPRYKVELVRVQDEGLQNSSSSSKKDFMELLIVMCFWSIFVYGMINYTSLHEEVWTLLSFFFPAMSIPLILYTILHIVEVKTRRDVITSTTKTTSKIAIQ